MVQNVSSPALDFNRFITEPTRGFSDRTWVFAAIHEWLTKADGTRFFLLSGEPGSGKTAIAARLCQFSLGSPPPSGLTAFTPGFLSAYHFCSIQGGGLIHPQTFAESLALQLSARYQEFAQALIEMSSDQRIQLGVEQRIESNTGQVVGIQIKKLSVIGILPEDVFNRVVRRPLQALFAAAPTTQVIILVDALDEALAYQGKRNIVSLLAQTGDLPAEVRFILTCRNGSGIVERFNSKHLLDLSASEHSLDTDNDIRRYVKQRMAEGDMKGYVAAIGSQAEVEDHLVEHASGNFLYAQFFLEEVIAGKRSLSNLVGLPIGLYGLYRHYLDRLVPDVLGAKNTSPKWTRRLQPLLGSLSVATPAAPQDVLPGWLRLGEGIVWPLLGEVSQLTERDPVYGGSYRLYHRSMAEFLITREYQEERVVQFNRYYTPSKEQHERIVRYYLTSFRGDWQHCDHYGLRQLVSHMQALLSQEKTRKKRSKLVEELYTVVLDPAFQRAQREQLGDIHVTLTDLRTTLEIALECNDLIKALACIGYYRDIIHSQSISEAVFDAAQAGNFELALQRASHYGFTPKPSGVWESILRLYIAWEAAEQGDSKEVQKIISGTERLPFLGSSVPLHVSWSKMLSDAFLVRIANTVARTSGDTQDAKVWLTRWGSDQDAQALLTSYGLARPLDPFSLQTLMAKINQRLIEFEQLVDEGAAEAVSSVPFFNEEIVGEQAASLQDLLAQVAADAEGQEAIDRVVQLVVPNPYPRYRDIALVALGVACLAVPQTKWVRQHLQSILRTALDQEGVTFTFDLPAILLAEAEKRGIPAPALAEYLALATASSDRWGTCMRARSARAAALFWQGQTADAVIELKKAEEQDRGFAGYAVMTLLSLASRYMEFGFGPATSSALVALLASASWQAEQVRDVQFSQERKELLRRYSEWVDGGTIPDRETALASLSATQDPEIRRVYKDFVSAHWVRKDHLDPDGVKALLSMTLADGTRLDALLGRLLGPGIHELSDSDLTEAIHLCAAHFTSSQPWKLRQWR